MKQNRKNQSKRQRKKDIAETEKKDTPAPADTEKKEQPPAEAQLKFIEHIKSQTLMEGDPLTLQCTCEGNLDDAEFIWFRNNKEIPENPDFRREQSGNVFKLIVTEVFPEDSGVFSALLKSKSSSNQQVSSCSVIIQARDEEALDPCFTEFPQSVSLEEGGKAKFTCKLSGTAPMTAQWNQNGKALDKESSRFLVNNGENEFSLEIPVVLVTDHGQYHITVSNDKGEMTAAFSLHVDQL